MTITRRPPGQDNMSIDPKDYEIRIVVFGSRSLKDKTLFHEKLMDYLEEFEGKPILFISGAALRGADDFIIRWCKKYHYPCREYPAIWKPQGPNGPTDMAAGFTRNTHMSKVANYGLGFYDGESHGTAHMIEQCELQKIHFKIHKFKPEDYDQHKHKENLRVNGRITRHKTGDAHNLVK